MIETTRTHAGHDTPAAGGALPDDAALRRAVDAYHDQLFGTAVERLGDQADLAPRVVEQTFVHAWHERARIAEAGLAHFLADDVQHRAARALSRRSAAHRVGHHGASDPNAPAHAHPIADPDRELAWTHIADVIRREANSAEAHARAVRAAHHEAAEHIKSVGATASWYRPVLAGIGIAVAAVGGIWLMDRVSRPAKLAAAVSTGTARTVESRQGQLASMELAEGTRVRLAPDSRVRIPENFGAELRAVRVQGAASFAVAAGQPQPLWVFVGRAAVVATGTRFTVRHYAGDRGALIRLDEGAASVRVDDVEHALAPGKALFVPDSGAPRAPTAGELQEGVSWTEGRVTLSDRPFGEALSALQRWYGSDVRAADQAILERRVSISVPLDSVQAAIAAIERAGSVRFGYLGEHMVFMDRDKVSGAGR